MDLKQCEKLPYLGHFGRSTGHICAGAACGGCRRSGTAAACCARVSCARPGCAFRVRGPPACALVRLKPGPLRACFCSREFFPGCARCGGPRSFWQSLTARGVGGDSPAAQIAPAQIGNSCGLLRGFIIPLAAAGCHALKAFSTPAVLKLYLVSSLKSAGVNIWLCCCYAPVKGSVMYL